MDNDIGQIILDELRAHRIESADRHEALDTRVRGVEHWVSNAEGKVTAFGVFCGIVGGGIAWVADLFHK